ncbi:unnamed protein product, partial [Oppiella nova]
MGSPFSKYPNVGPFGTYDDITNVVKRGDLIEIKRTLIRHWVICKFIDDQGVVWCCHVSKLERMGKKKVFFRCQPLSDILKGDRGSSAPEGNRQSMDLCRVNNKEIQARQRGLTARPLDEVFADLEALEGQTMEYELTGLNCEFYCTLLKYGRGWSSQVDIAMSMVEGGLIGVALHLATTASIGPLSALNQGKNIENNENVQRQIRSMVTEHREAVAMAQRLNAENARRKRYKRFTKLIFTAMLFIIALVLGYYLGLSASSVSSDLDIKQVVASGDLIEIQRSGYNHWVICESNDPNDPNDQGGKGGTVWCYHVSSINSRAKNKVYVRYEALIDILPKRTGLKGGTCVGSTIRNRRPTRLM